MKLVKYYDILLLTRKVINTMNQKSTDNNVGKFSSFTKAKIFIVVLILIILLSLVVGYKIFNYKKQDEMYNNAISLKYEMKYDSAEKIFGI